MSKCDFGFLKAPAGHDHAVEGLRALRLGRDVCLNRCKDASEPAARKIATGLPLTHGVARFFSVRINERYDFWTSTLPIS